MNKYAWTGVSAVILILISVSEVFPAEFHWQNIGRENLKVKTLLLNPEQEQAIYLGSENGVFKSEDAGASWRNVLSIRAGRGCVNFLFSLPREKPIYAATTKGLFVSLNRGRTWQRLFKGKNQSEENCTAALVLAGGIYLGTEAGLFTSQDNGRTWHRAAGILGNSAIANITAYPGEPDYIYLACSAGVFKKEKENWELIFSGRRAKEERDNDEEGRIEEAGGEGLEIRFVAIDPRQPSRLYLATSRGILHSQDKGESWQAMSDYGLLNRDVRFLLFSVSSEIYAATASAIFRYAEGRWQELSFNLSANRVNFLALDRGGNLYAACDTGLFKAQAGIDNDGRQNQALELYLDKEPRINLIQQAAISYAEVEPEKIMRWRKQAAKKAFLPEVSVGVDKNASDLWHWETGSTTKNEDDILRRGKNSLEWSVNCSWDLGELIWNEDQTSIDVRSRLMVELRDDILDEVTRLYFERIRTMVELDNLSIEERKRRLEKEIKIRELTASLDALTGGYFSRQLAENNTPS